MKICCSVEKKASSGLLCLSFNVRTQSTSDITAPIAEPTLASLAEARLAVISSLSSYAVACSSCFLLLPRLKGKWFAGNVPDRYARLQNWNLGDPAAFPDRCTAYYYFTSPTLQNGGCNEAYHLWLSIMRCQSWEKIKKGGSWWTSTPVCRGVWCNGVCMSWLAEKWFMVSLTKADNGRAGPWRTHCWTKSKWWISEVPKYRCHVERSRCFHISICTHISNSHLGSTFA